jgi:hypothetical protein
MTERYGSGYGEERGRRPSGRGAVTERLAAHDQDAREIDLTDEATRRAQEEAGRDHDIDRTSAGAFEPPPPSDDPRAEESGPDSSIFEVDEQARREEQEREEQERVEPERDAQERTGYEPAADGTEVTEPGAAVDDEPGEGRADEMPITPTPVPAAEAPGDVATAPGLPETSAAAPPTAAPATAAAAGPAGSLLGTLDVAEIRSRFLDIQAGFVDEPRQAVEEAGRFVDDLIQQVAAALQQQRGQLTGAAAEGSTEDLRLALRAYRQFVDRLLGLAS